MLLTLCLTLGIANVFIMVVAAGSTEPMFAAGGQHSLALKSDGTVWAWGLNDYNQLGNGTATNSSKPVQVPGLNNASAIAAGYFHSLALKSDGTVWAWGLNGHGRLGNGTTVDSGTPVQVLGLSNVSAIVAGHDHSLALKSDGTVWAWGANHIGQLGNGTTANSSTSVQVTGLLLSPLPETPTSMVSDTDAGEGSIGFSPSAIVLIVGAGLLVVLVLVLIIRHDKESSSK